MVEQITEEQIGVEGAEDGMHVFQVQGDDRGRGIVGDRYGSPVGYVEVSEAGVAKGILLPLPQRVTDLGGAASGLS